MLQLKIIYMGLGFHCYSLDTEEVAGNGATIQKAIASYLELYWLKFNKAPKYKWS